MGENNNVLVSMLLLSLVISVAGTVIVAEKIGFIFNGINGAVTGTSSLNISEDITISLLDSAINFGVGTVDPDSDYALLDSRSGFDTTGGSWSNITDQIIVRNDGTMGLNVTFTSSRNSGKNATSFACAGDVGNCGYGLSNSGPNQELSFAYVVSDSDLGSCPYGLQNSLTEISEADVELEACGCLKAFPPGDEIALNLQVGIPADASGNKEATFTFTSVPSGEAC